MQRGVNKLWSGHPAPQVESHEPVRGDDGLQGQGGEDAESPGALPCLLDVVGRHHHATEATVWRQRSTR